MLEFVNVDSLNERAPADHQRFETAQPFKHIAFDDLVLPQRLADLVAAFPSPEWNGWADVNHEHQRYKHSCSDSATIPHPLRELIYELNSASFMRWLEQLTGIAQILPDPHLLGGGLHMTTPGGTLTPHTDFHIVKGNPLFRRLNLLLYLNEDWTEEHNGKLELWDKKKDRIELEVAPELGRCVIFQTDDVSMHGFSKPIAGAPRRSVAMYYYTAQDTEAFSGDGVTYWRTETVRTHGTAERLRLQAHRVLLYLSHASSAFSWRAAKTADSLRR